MPKPNLTIDFESRSPLDLTKVGIYRYTEHRDTRVLICSAHYKGQWCELHDMRDAPDWLLDALEDDDVPIHAHNATVERLLIERKLGPDFDWPVPRRKRWRCSAARVRRLALPASLDKVGTALGLETVKDKKGKALIRALSKPQKYDPLHGFIYNNDPIKLKEFGEYCTQDVRTEMAVDDATYDLPEQEQRYYQLTEKINDRGVRVDVALIERLVWRANEYTEILNERICKLTGGYVRALTEVARIKSWVEQETGVVMQTLRKEDMDGLMQEAADLNMPREVVEVLKIRQEGAKSSISKLLAILSRVCKDGRVRGAFVYHGASTGRYTSMGVQLQNLVREVLKELEDRIKNVDDFTLVDISRCIRACFIPAEGHVFIDVDYNAIEARGVGWLAGAKKLLKIYRENGDPYCEMGTVIYGRVITKADEWERFVGKQTILGCGYGMGPAKFEAQCIKFGKPVGIDIAEKSVAAYRREYPEIPALWYDVGDAAIAAVKHPGRVFEAAKGKLQFKFVDGYLRMKLPGGRCLFYKDPKILKGKYGPELSYMAEHPITKQWVRERTWGGKLVENAVQAFCRDLLFDAMERLEDKEIPIVLSVHDQLVAEVLKEDAEWAKKHVEKEMVSLPPWAHGFPVTAEPKITMRFGK